MDSILEVIFNFIFETIKLIFYVLIWNIVFFYIGAAILKIFTFLKFPKGQQLEKHVNVISGVGLNFVYILWSSIATYNYTTNAYFLISGFLITAIQFF